MSLESIYYISQIIAVAAILGSLIFVGIQVRQNTAQQKREELISIQHGQNAVIAQHTDPLVFSGYVRTATLQNPSIEDRSAAIIWVIQYLNHFQVVHEFYKTGSLDEEQYQLWLGFAVAAVAPAGIRKWWEEENGRLAFHTEVRALIEQKLADKDNPVVPLTEMWSHYGGQEWDTGSRA